jgi:LAS superfamily LD-carboxypeptidase LdcB
MNSRTVAASGGAAAVVFGCALLASCSSGTGGTAVGPTQVTGFVTVTPSSSVPAHQPPSSADESTASDNGPTETTDSSEPTQTGTGETASAPSTAHTSASRSSRITATLGPSTDADGEPVVAYWLGDPPADPQTPGPEGGPTCKADSQYVNESTTGLQPDVVTAWAAAVATAKRAGITLCLNDGKRSRDQQLAQFAEYEKQYGKEVAEQLVLPPGRSAHVLGVAVDAQPEAGWQWLQKTKGSLGFCRRYDNEGWHFEYAPQFKTAGCPARLPKPVG